MKEPNEKEIKESDAIMEFLQWRAEDGNKSVKLMIEYLALLGLLVVLVILALNLAGIIPHTEITRVCTVVETVKGVI